jgi:hypothetical protein
MQSSCKDRLDKLLLHSENSDLKIIDNLKPQIGYENEFNSAKTEYKECANNYQYIIDKFVSNTETLNLLSIHSYSICLDVCKNLIKQNKQNESEARKCITDCNNYRNINLDAAHDFIIEDIQNTKNNINKL